MIWIEKTNVGNPSRKFVLYVLGTHMGGDGRGPYRIDELAQVTELAEEDVREHLAALARDGLIGWTVRAADQSDWFEIRHPELPPMPEM